MDAILQLELEKEFLEHRINEINKQIKRIKLSYNEGNDMGYLFNIFKYFAGDKYFDFDRVLYNKQRIGDGVYMTYVGDDIQIYIYKRTTFKLASSMEIIENESEEIKYGLYSHVRVIINDVPVCDRDDLIKSPHSLNYHV